MPKASNSSWGASTLLTRPPLLQLATNVPVSESRGDCCGDSSADCAGPANEALSDELAIAYYGFDTPSPDECTFGKRTYSRRRKRLIEKRRKRKNSIFGRRDSFDGLSPYMGQRRRYARRRKRPARRFKSKLRAHELSAQLARLSFQSSENDEDSKQEKAAADFVVFEDVFDDGNAGKVASPDSKSQASSPLSMLSASCENILSASKIIIKKRVRFAPLVSIRHYNSKFDQENYPPSF